MPAGVVQLAGPEATTAPHGVTEAVRYSICTLVSKPDEYHRMHDSFAARGFTFADCEYLCIDNTRGNAFDAYAGANLFLRSARGRYVVLCHQDVELLQHGRERLDAVLAELDRTDANWALCGNAGAARFGVIALRITDRYCVDGSFNGPFPVRCNSLDENFIVIRAEANLALPRSGHGFHFYGTELCLVAEMLGWNAYVVDFHLRHHGVGDKGPAFDLQKQALIDRYRLLMRSRWLSTPSTDLFLSGSTLWNRLLNHHRSYQWARVVAEMFYKWRTR